jgi:hypothetical protein
MNDISDYQHRISEIPPDITGYLENFCGEMMELETDHLLPLLRLVVEALLPFPYISPLLAQE